MAVQPETRFPRLPSSHLKLLRWGTKSFYFYFWSAPSLGLPLAWTLGKHGFPHLAALKLPLSQLGFYKPLEAPAALSSLPSPSGRREASVLLVGSTGEGTWPPLTLLSSGTSPSPIGGFWGRWKTLWCPTDTALSPLPVAVYPYGKIQTPRRVGRRAGSPTEGQQGPAPLRRASLCATPCPHHLSHSLEVEMESF